MPSSSSYSSPSDPKKAAKQFRKDLRDGNPNALRLAREAFRDLSGLTDAQVPDHMGNQRCQHVIAQLRGAKKWESASQLRMAQVVGLLGTEDLSILARHAEQIPAGSKLRTMMESIMDRRMGCRATASQKDCDELIAWSFTVLPADQRQNSPLGPVLRIEPATQHPDDHDFDPDFHYIGDLDAPGEL